MMLSFSYEMPVTTNGENLSACCAHHGTTRRLTGEKVILSSEEWEEWYLRKGNIACTLSPEIFLSAMG